MSEAITRPAPFVDAGAGDLHHVLRGAIRMHRHFELSAQRLELVDGGRTIHVRGDESRRTPLGLEPARQLGRGRRLA